MRLPSILVLALAILPAGVARAEVQVTPSLGLRVGGEVDLDFDSDDTVDTTPSLGLTFDISRAPEKWLTAFWSGQRTKFSASGFSPQDRTFDLDLHYFQAGGVYRPRRDKGAQPFVMVAAGLTWIVPHASGFDGDVGLSGSLGGGALFPIGKRLSFRLEGRGYATFTKMELRGICGGAGCSINFSGTGSLQFEALAGLTIPF
jgi:hypothetical protein